MQQNQEWWKAKVRRARKEYIIIQNQIDNEGKSEGRLQTCNRGCGHYTITLMILVTLQYVTQLSKLLVMLVM